MADLTKIRNLRENQLNEIAIGEIVLNVDALTYVTKNSAGKVVPYDIDYKLPDGDATHLYLKWDETTQQYTARTVAEFISDLAISDVPEGSATALYLKWNNSTDPKRWEALTLAQFKTALAYTTIDAGSATLLYPKWNNSLAKYEGQLPSTVATDIGAVSTLNWGNPEGGYLFDGTDDYVSVPDNDNLDFGTGDFSVGCNVKLSDYTPSAEKILLEKHASNLGYKLLLTTDSKLKLQLGNGSDFTTYSYVTDAISLTDNSTYHISVSITRASNALFYVNGTLVKTVDISGSVAQTVSNTGALNVMGNGTTYHYGLGYLIRLFNRALTQAEVTKLYNNGRPDLAQLDYVDILAGNKYISNFTGGVDGWSIVRGNLTAPETIDGEDYTLKLIITNVAGNHPLISPVPLTADKSVNIRFSYYIPSTNSNIDGFLLTNNTGATTLLDRRSTATTPATLDAWTTIDITTTLAGTGIKIYTSDGVTDIYTDAGGDDVFAIKSVYLIQLGCVAEYLPRNAGHYTWIETQNGLHGTATGGVIPLSNKVGDTKTAYLLTTSTSPTMTDVIKAGWKVESIVITTGYELTDIDVVQETSSVALLNNKTLNNGSFTWTVADHNVYPTADKDLVFTLTGNGGAGTHIYVNLKKIV